MRFLTDVAESMADAIWFFKGAQYARPASIDAGSGDCATLEEQTRQGRLWLLDLLAGRKRVIVPDEERVSTTGDGIAIKTVRNDGGLMVLTFGELERLIDGLRDTADIRDKRDAQQLLQSILEQFRTQSKAAAERSDHLPF